MTDQIISNIIKEAQRIEEDCEHSAKGHFNASDGWVRVHYGLGVPLITAAAAAGSQTLYDNPVLATIFALVATVLASLQTFINPEEKVSTHKTSGGKYLTLRNQTRSFREIELLGMDASKAVQRIRELSAQRNDLNQSSRSIARKCYWQAKTDIDTGYAQYRADNND